MTNRKCHILSKNRMNKGPGLVILHQSVEPVPHTPLRYWVQIPRYLPVSVGQKTVPMSDYFVEFIVTGCLIQIEWLWAYFEAYII
jgi:hypothetical protein